MTSNYIHSLKTIVFLISIAGAFLTAKSQADCRLDLTTISPIVNPGTAMVLEYEWDSLQRMEIMLLDTSRLAIITQDGCMRHRIRYQLEGFQPLEDPQEATWFEFTQSFVRDLFQHSPNFHNTWIPFLESFEQQLYVRGTNRQFDVSLGSQDFICYIQDLPHQNPAIYIEQIGFLFKEKIRTKER